MSFYSGQDGGGVGVSMSRLQAILTYERALAADTTSMGHSDYSFKPVKPIINFEMNEYYTASMMTTAPFLYGAQPNMGLYFQPDGPHENPADLLPQGKIKEAREVQEAAAEPLRGDLVFVGKKLNTIGCEGLNFDTGGSAGDADFWADLQAVRDLADGTGDVAVAGRIVSLRKMGKMTFGHIADIDGRFQFLMKKDFLEDSYQRFKDTVDIGDYLGLRGEMFDQESYGIMDGGGIY